MFKTNKKEKGSLDKYIVLLMTVIVLTILVITFISSLSNFDVKDEIDMIARKYIIQIETEGYLKEETKETLLNALKDAGMINIDLTGTTMNPVGYGNVCTLVISGEIPIRKYTLKNIFEYNEDIEYIDTYIKKTSTTQR